MLRVPEIDASWDVCRAAIAYIEAGWWVLPIEPGTKKPAVFLGKGWPRRSSRDIEEAVAWFTGTPYGLALHAGRSHSLIIDVDEPDEVPDFLSALLWDETGAPLVPYQSSRPDTPRRGHYLFAQPTDRLLGNASGLLNRTWGEVRGSNGIIVVAPTTHSKGGEYRWLRVGEVPPLPPAIADRLPDASAQIDAASEDAVSTFLKETNGNANPYLMRAALEKFNGDVAAGASRHYTAVSVACWMMREARTGLYPAREAANSLYQAFRTALAGDRHRHPLAEFKAILAYAVAQALEVDPDERRGEVEARLTAVAARTAAEIGISPPPRNPVAEIVDKKTRDPGEYFADRTIGLNVELLAEDVMSLGPLAWGVDDGFWSYDGGVWRSERDVVKNRVIKLLGPRYRQAHAANAFDVVRASVGRIACDAIDGYINCANGMLDWRGGRLLAHGSDYGSTVQLPFVWDETGTARCDAFDAFLTNVLSPDYVELAWQMLGYLMYSGNPMQVAFLFYGTGANGKGTLLRVIEALLGRENCSHESLDALNRNRFSAVNLFGRIANLAGDIDGTFQESTAMFKALTGEDTIGGERKYGDRFSFMSWAVPVFTCNKIPGSADTSEGYLRRWVMLEFGRTISAKDRIYGYSDLLINELPGIALKAVAALRKLMEERTFKNDGDIIGGQETFARAIDQVRLWIDEATEPQPDARPERTSLYKSYRAWAIESGQGPLRAAEFYHRLAAAGYPAVKVRGMRHHLGLRVTELRVKGQQDEIEDVAMWR